MSNRSGHETSSVPNPSDTGTERYEELIRNLARREAELNLREEVVVSRESQIRVSSAKQRDILATAASRMDSIGRSPYEEVFKDFPLGISLALADILEAARRQARAELRGEFEELAKAQAELAASAGKAAEPLVKAVTLRADHLERLLDEGLDRNRELANQQAGRRSAVDVAALVESIAARTAELIGARPDGQIG